jgi:peptide/nickel transport system substrate-binding protein
LRSRRSAITTGIAALTLTVTLGACTSGGVTSSGGGGGGGGSPHRGGTLRLLGQSDIFNLDPVSAYYTVSSMLERMWTRQLFSYRNVSNWTEQTTPVPDVATEMPTTTNGGITDSGKTYTIHIRSGVMWDTSPPRQVTAADFVRQFKVLCNPASPVGAPGYFTSTIVGMQNYCNGFAKVKATASAISGYVNSHNLPGVVAAGPQTLVFHLINPATDFVNILAMGFCSARPVENMQYVPDSPQYRQHTLSDGPYKITAYTADRSFTLARNPAWKATTDPLRHAYVNAVTVTEGLDSAGVQQQLQAGTGDMEWDVGPPPQDLPSLMSSHNSGLVISAQPTGFTYVTLNQYAGPFTNLKVRQAVAYALNKNAIVRILGGPSIAQPATQFMLPGSVGYVGNFNPYPNNSNNGDAAKSKALLKEAGQSNVTIKLIYSTTDPTPREAQVLESALQAGGFTVKLMPVTQSDWYAKYLEQPSTAKSGVWDISLPGWIPDWFGNNGRATIQPLFSSPGELSNDFTGYNSPVTNGLINKALTSTTKSAAASYWAQANEQVVKDVADVPLINQRWTLYHSAQVHGCIFFVNALNCDPTNVWLSG